MTPVDQKTAEIARITMAEICRKMIDGSIDLVSGSRAVQRLYLNVPPPERDLIFPIIGFESETDTYPLGEVRLRYDCDTLRLLDDELKEYTERVRDSVLSACKAIVSNYTI